MPKTIDTSIGKVNCTLTDASHVFITETNRDEPLVVHGVAYHVSIHLYRQSYGSWSPQRAGERANLYMSRVPYSTKEPSMAARKKVREVLVAVWTENVTDKDRNEAEIVSLAEKVENQKQDVERLKNELNTATKNLRSSFLELQRLKEEATSVATGRTGYGLVSKGKAQG